ncbi:MAG: hypothetical protein WA003_08800 [Desulfuromonadaceae bacterium]
MTVVDLYAAVEEHLIILKATGEDWDLYWFEDEFDMGIKRGSEIVFRAPWISKIHDWTSLEVDKLKQGRSSDKTDPGIG